MLARTDDWIEEGCANLERFLRGEVGRATYLAHEAGIVAGLRDELHRGYAGELLRREGLIELFTGLRELDYRAALLSVGAQVLGAEFDTITDVVRAA
jgi:hypothetical protein